LNYKYRLVVEKQIPHLKIYKNITRPVLIQIPCKTYKPPHNTVQA